MPVAVPVDLSSMEFWARPAAERERGFARLRAEAPLSWQDPLEDVLGVNPIEPTGYWAVVRHADIKRISRSPQTFCSGQGVMIGDAPQEFLEMSLSFLAMDVPRHTKLRGLVSAAFTPRQVRRIEEGIRRNAALVVDEALPLGGGDVVDVLAKRLPLLTISEMLGVPEEERERVMQAADALVSVADPEYLGDRDPLAVLGENLWYLTQTAQALAAAREADPADDLMTALVQAEVDGERLTHAEIGAFFVLLSVAGNDTTRHTTTHGLHALDRHPEQRAWLREDLDARLPGAIEEMIRWATPVMTFRRTVVEPVELHGVTLEPGAKVVLFYTSANRDEDVFADPTALDLSRDPNRHLGFGGGGPHFCLGASLARTQLRAIFEQVERRMTDLSVGDLDPVTGAFIHGVRGLPGSWSPNPS